MNDHVSPYDIKLMAYLGKAVGWQQKPGLTHYLQGDGIYLHNYTADILPTLFPPGLSIPSRFRIVYIEVNSDGTDLVPILRKIGVLPPRVTLLIRKSTHAFSMTPPFTDEFIAELKRFPKLSLAKWGVGDLVRFFHGPPPRALDSLDILGYQESNYRMDGELMKSLIAWIPQLRRLALEDLWLGIDFNKLAEAVCTPHSRMEECIFNERYLGHLSRAIAFWGKLPDSLRVLDLYGLPIGQETIDIVSSPIEVFRFILDELKLSWLQKTGTSPFGTTVESIRQMIDRTRGTLRHLEMVGPSTVLHASIHLPLPSKLETLKIGKWDPDSWDEVGKIIFDPSCNLKAIKVGYIDAEGSQDGRDAPDDFALRIRAETRITEFDSSAHYLDPDLARGGFPIIQAILSLSYLPRFKYATPRLWSVVTSSDVPWHDLIIPIIEFLGWKLPHHPKMVHAPWIGV